MITRPEAIHRVNWDFGKSLFHDLKIIVKIYNEPKWSFDISKDNLYFQMFQGWCNGAGFYFGIQTDVNRKGIGSTGKGLIFSRWKTKDLSNARPNSGGWKEKGKENEYFVSIRKNYKWTTHTYQLKIAYIESDDQGDWYGVWIKDLDENNENFLGSLRFPKVEPNEAGIRDHGAPARQTFTELYGKGSEDNLPSWHVSIKKIIIDNNIRPKHATTEFGQFSNSDILYDEKTKEIHFFSGPDIVRKNNPVRLF